MATELLLILLIALLLGYIIFLHIRLAKRNIFIESTLERFSGHGKNWSTEEMMKFLHEIRNISHYNSFFTDKLFEDKSLGFLLENIKDSKIFIHYTKFESDALSIVKDGFLYAESFYKTAQPVLNDKLDLLIKHNGKKSFGDYIVVLCLSEKIFDYYSAGIVKNGIRGYSVENIFTEKTPYRNDNGDMVYQIPNRFVQGFINHQTGKISRNPEFDPAYDSPAFARNLELLKSGTVS